MSKYIGYATIVVLILVSAGAVHALGSGDKALEVDKKVRSSNGRIYVSIDLSTLGDQWVKAVNVKEYIPKGLFKDTNDGVFTGFGLVWNMGQIEKKETASYTLRIPEISEPTTYELKTVVEYQNHDDLMTLEMTSYLTVNPDGRARIDNGKDIQSVKAEGKGYSKVHWARPNFESSRYNSDDGNGNNGKGKGRNGNNGNGKGNGVGNGDSDDDDGNGNGNGNGGGNDNGDDGNGNGNGKGKGGKK